MNDNGHVGTTTLSRRSVIQAGFASLAAVRMGGSWTAFAQDSTPSGTLIEGGIGGPTVFIPVVEANRASRLMFDALVALDPETGEAKPHLATDWTISDDGLTYTFTLVDNAVFHDGTPLTADDVAFTFNLLIDEATASPYNSVFAPRIKSVTAVDPTTVEFVLNNPVASFVADTAAYAIGTLPKHIVSEIPPADLVTSEFATVKPIGSGPFKFGEFAAGEALTLTNNPDYFLGTPALEAVVIKYLKDSTASYQQLKTGEVDVAEVAASFVEDANAQANFTPVVYDTNRMQMFGFCQDEANGAPCLQDVKVRQALAHAIDRQLLIDKILNGMATVAMGAQSTISWAHNPDGITTTYDYDPEKASALLEEAGWVAGDDGIRAKDGERLSFKIAADANNKNDEGLAMALQELLAEVGVEATPDFIASDAFWGNLMAHTFQAALVNLTFPPDPDQSLIWDSAGIDGGFNIFAYNSPEADTLLHDGLATTDIEERKKIYTELDNLLLTDMPAFVMYYSKSATGVANRVQNYTPCAIAYSFAPHETAYTWSVTE